MFNNRDISWLGFNYRVLLEATDKRVPLFERMKYLSIFSSNLDEFFRVRYPALIALSRLNERTKQKASIEIHDDIPERIQNEVNRQLNLFGEILHAEIIPELKNDNIIFYYGTAIKDEHIMEVRELFFSHVLAFIQPVFLEGNNKSGFVPENNQLYFIIILKETNKDSQRNVVINIPSNKIERFFTLTALEGSSYVIFLDDIIRTNAQYIFPKMELQSIYSIKFNRNAELSLGEEYSGDLLNKIERQLKKRDIGLPSRFLYESGMPGNLQLFLAAVFNIKYEDMFVGGRYHQLSDLSSFPLFNKKLQFQKLQQLDTNHIKGSGNIFHILQQQDVLLHLPYQSYNPVLSFFNQAAVDQEVTDIYITLYRVASESYIVNALISAAKNGKNVVAFIELKARFDEANNIKWSRAMKDAGINLVYSLPQIKVHSKTALVKKKTPNGQIGYAIICTGNFNEVTAKFYTDHVLMTSKVELINELVLLFEFLKKGYYGLGDGKVPFKELLVAQFNLVDELERRIKKEIKKARMGEPARIRIKVNNLEDPSIIKLLHSAGDEGVKVELIIRSVCCIETGVNKNIVVRRIVDRFLEHTRLFIFGSDENEAVFIGSSDLMIRNLRHRIEVCVPVKDAICKKEILDYFSLQWSDNTKAVELLPDNQQVVVNKGDSISKNGQESIYEYLKGKL